MRTVLVLCIAVFASALQLPSTRRLLITNTRASTFAKAKSSKKKTAGATVAPRGFGAAPPPPPKRAPPPPPRPSDGRPRLETVDLGKGKSVSVMLPPDGGNAEPSEAELRKLEIKKDAVLQAGVLGAYKHLYGAGDVVWPASVALARLLAHVPSLTAGLRVLEVGCGLGAAGLAAATAGASAVVLSDRDEAVLGYAREAAAANGVESVVSTASLDWAATDDELRGALGTDFAGFDVIVGADVLYDAGAARALAALLARLLPADAPRQQRCVLADPPQRECRTAFAEACATHGLAVEDDPLPGPEGARMLTVGRAE